MKAFLLNLQPKEKQKLWKVLDEEAMNGSVWTFDYTSVNCMSMVTYAIDKAIAPAEVKLKTLPQVVKEDLLTPEMMKAVMPQAVIADASGKVRSLSIGKPSTLLPQVYQDNPCWFRPWMALVLTVLIIVIAIGLYRKKTTRNKKSKG